MRSSVGALLLILVACDVAPTPALDGGAHDDVGGGPIELVDGGPAPSCGALEVDLPFTLLGPGASRVPIALVHPPAGTSSISELVAADHLSVIVEGDAVEWRADRFIAIVPGEVTVRVELGRCRVESKIEVLRHSSFASELIDLDLGEGAGHGTDALPQIVLGPPVGAGRYAGSLDVLSLGLGGSITVGFSELQIYDGPGLDFIVFENAFRVAGGAAVFAEPGVVSIFTPAGLELEFPCDASYPYDGCAGRSPVFSSPDNDRSATVPLEAGGDGFDLDSHSALADRIRIRDVSTTTTGSNSGFDLDAIALVHAWPRTVRSIETEPALVVLAVDERRLLPPVAALTEDGARLEGIAAHVESEDPEVVAIEEPLIRALRPGRARIVFRAGPHEASALIEVSP